MNEVNIAQGHLLREYLRGRNRLVTYAEVMQIFNLDRYTLAPVLTFTTLLDVREGVPIQTSKIVLKHHKVPSEGYQKTTQARGSEKKTEAVGFLKQVTEELQ
jgi:hypothetical protein